MSRKLSFASQSRSSTSPQILLEITKAHLESANNTEDKAASLAYCGEAKASLSRLKRSVKSSRVLETLDGLVIRDEVVALFIERGNILDRLGHADKALASQKKAESWKSLQIPLKKRDSVQMLTKVIPFGQMFKPRDGQGLLPTPPNELEAQLLDSKPQRGKRENAQLPEGIFENNVTKTISRYKLLEPDEHLESTAQLVFCISILTLYNPSDPMAQSLDVGEVERRNNFEQLSDEERSWVIATLQDPDEIKRLHLLVENIVAAFVSDELKKQETIIEVVSLAPILNSELFRILLKCLINKIEKSVMLETHMVEGLAKLIQVCEPGRLCHDDLIKILEVLGKRLKDTHHESAEKIYGLTMAMSHVLDAMADSQVKGIKREELFMPLSDYLKTLRGSADPHLVYQAAYAHQALMYIPDDETPWQAASRRAGRIIRGISGVVSAAKGFDLNGFIDGLAQLQDGAAEALELLGRGVDGVFTFLESGEDFITSIKNGLTTREKHPFYQALRGMDSLIQGGQFIDFKRFISEAACRRDPIFQWGLCHRLGDLAVSSHWDDHTRSSSVTLLGEFYDNDETWGEQRRVKQWILSIFGHMKPMLHGPVAEKAQGLHRELGTKGSEYKQTIYRETVTQVNTVSYNPFKPISLAPPTSSYLLDRVQNKPDVEVDLRRLGRQRIKERGEHVYIEPNARASLQSREEDQFLLKDRIRDFIFSPNLKVFLLLGESGAGKSAFCTALECQLWKEYNEKKHDRIPLHINLPAIDRPENDLVAKQLRRAHFTEPQIREMKLNRKFILICDGYDESQLVHNLYTSNRLNQKGEWDAQMLIACRSEYLGNEYKDQFQPSRQRKNPQLRQYDESVITPFSEKQVDKYIYDFVTSTKSEWRITDYQSVFKKIPTLHDLVKNPFLLTLALDALPRLVDPNKDLSTTRITRVALYDQFVELWLDREKQKLSAKKDKSSFEKKALDSLIEEGFTENGITYLKDLASAVYREQDGNPVVEYARIRDRGTWKEIYFGQEDEKQLLRKASPITRFGNQFQFIHKSILEYCVARAVFEPQKGECVSIEPPPKARRGSIGSILSFESQCAPEEVVAAAVEQPILDSPLAQKNFVGEPSILEFLVERVQNEPLFKQQLHAILERSKTDKDDKRVRKAAANAITILVKAGIQFSGADLNGVQIPGADLSHGVFDSTQFQRADLRKVDFHNIWMRHANFSGAKMTGVKFGELPFLTEAHDIRCCTHTKDGKLCAVGLENGSVSIYDTSNWEKILTLKAQVFAVNSLAFSNNGSRLIVGYNGRYLKLWDIEADKLLFSYKHDAQDGHVTDVKYSPKDNQVASSSMDGTVRLWEVETDNCKYVFRGHTGLVKSIAYSPDGKFIASGGNDKTVRIWNTITGKHYKTFSNHTDRVNAIAFSPNMELQVATCSSDGTAWLWNFETDISIRLSGHTDHIRNIIYSPNGKIVATGSLDRTVMLWGAEKGDRLHVLVGHTDWVKSIAFSPKSDRVVSTSYDKTLRLWEVGNGKCRQVFHGHTDTVNSVIYIPNENQIASGGKDGTLRLWDSEAGKGHQTLRGHTQPVMSIEYSPNGKFIASGSKDKSVRLWDVATGACEYVLDGHTGEVIGTVYSPDGAWLATRGTDHTVRLWNSATGDMCHILEGHTGWIECAVFSPDSKILATGSRDEDIHLWDVESGDCICSLIGHEGPITSIAFSPNGKLASASEDESIRIWDVESGNSEDVLMSHDECITSVTFSPSGHQLVSGSKDKTVRVYSMATGSNIFHHKVHKGPVTSVIYSPTGKQYASTGQDNEVVLRNTVTGLLDRVLRGHTQWISCTEYSPKGDMIATGSLDNTVRVWETKSGGHLLVVIEGFRDMVNCISWNRASSEYFLVTGSCDLSVRQWQIIKDGDSSRAVLCWSSMQEGLTMTNVCIQDADGLSQ
ncbi:hypothetical protein BGZ76_000820, partial [Entomortierella beljakovae]